MRSIQAWVAGVPRFAGAPWIAGVLVAACALPGVARADAIDGHWCHEGGRRFEINGPMIVTPGGSRIEGQYDRHYFSYVVPANEPSGGSTVDMALMGEMMVRLKPANAPEETWRRCGPPISQNRQPIHG